LCKARQGQSKDYGIKPLHCIPLFIPFPFGFQVQALLHLLSFFPFSFTKMFFKGKKEK